MLMPVEPSTPIGTIKSFGQFGEQYEIGRVLYELDGGNDWMIEITMVKTGQKAEYQWSHMLDDPVVH